MDSSASSECRRLQTKRYCKDQGWSWMILVAACLIEFFMALSYTTGIFNVIFLDIFGKDKQTTAWVGSIQASLLNFFGAVSAFLASKIGSRKTVLVGCLIGYSGFFLTYFTTDFIYLFFTYGVLVGAGQGIVYLQCIVSIGFYFDKYRNLAFGVFYSAAGLGIIILPSLIQYLEDQYGWGGCMLIMAGMYLHILVGGAILRPQGAPPVVQEVGSCEKVNQIDMNNMKPQDIFGLSCLSLASFGSQPLNKNYVYHQVNGKGNKSASMMDISEKNHLSNNVDKCHQSYPNVNVCTSEVKHKNQSAQGKETRNSSSVVKETKTVTEQRIFIQKDENKKSASKFIKFTKIVFRNRLLLLYFNLCSQQAATFIVFVHFPAYFISHGASPEDISIFMFIIGICSVTCRLLMGAATNMKGDNVLLIYFGGTGIAAIFVLFCPFLVTTYTGQIIFVIGFGFYGNIYCALCPPLTLELCPLTDLSKVQSINLIMLGTGALTGPPFGGWLYDVVGEYDLTFYITGCLYLAGSLVLLLIPVLKVDTNNEVVKTYQVRDT